MLNDLRTTAFDGRAGKHVPLATEVMIKAVCPPTSVMLVPADGGNQATALVIFDIEARSRWAGALGPPAACFGSPAADPAVHAPGRPLPDSECDGQRRG